MDVEWLVVNRQADSSDTHSFDQFTVISSNLGEIIVLFSTTTLGKLTFVYKCFRLDALSQAPFVLTARVSTVR